MGSTHAHTAMGSTHAHTHARTRACTHAITVDLTDGDKITDTGLMHLASLGSGNHKLCL